MTCPECNEEDKQYFHLGSPETALSPQELPHFECGYCGNTYMSTELEDALADDWYDDMLWRESDFPDDEYDDDIWMEDLLNE